MRVKDLQHLADKRKDLKVKVFNPTNEDFSWKYDKTKYTIPKGEMVELSYVIGHHIAKHLVDKILTDKGLNTGNPKNRKSWEKIIIL